MQSKNLVKCAAAGSGKTWGICHEALEIIRAGSNKKILITTYTNKGVEAIETEFKKQNFGVLDKNIVIRSWYQFLLSDMIKPYQAYLTDINEVKSLDFSNLYGARNFNKSGTKERYVNRSGNIKINHASEMIILLNKLSENKVIERLEAIYTHAFIDEIQDMAGDDLSIIEIFMDSNIRTICVGDNKQATYKTHNTQKGKKQTGANVWAFFDYLEVNEKACLKKDLCSRRFNNEICIFANRIFHNENNISTSMKDTTEHDGVFLVFRKDIVTYHDYFKPIILKYDKKTQTSEYASLNFGQCKGQTFDRVLIFPNKPLLGFIEGKNLQSPEKYYVAVTRPRYSIAIVIDKFPSNENYRVETIKILNIKFTVMRFVAVDEIE